MKLHRHARTVLAIAPVVLCLACSGGVSGGSGEGADGETDVFAARVLPLLQADCSGGSCHDPGKSGAVTSGLAVGQSASDAYLSVRQLVVPGDSAGSELIEAMGGSMKAYSPASHLTAIAAWIDEGAKRWGVDDGSAPPLGPAYENVGLDVCTACHYGETVQWTKGVHGNMEELDAFHQPLDLGQDSRGFPYYGYKDLGRSPDCTTRCHDPLGDGYLLTEELTGNTPRPVIGCESCHGGGSEHFGTGPVPYPRPSAQRCGLCHDGGFEHNAYHPEGDRVVEDYTASAHMRSINDRVTVTLTLADGTEVATSDVRARCAKCHTDEGARLYREIEGGHDAIAAALPNDAPPVRDATPVQCRTCHHPHRPERLLFSAQSEGGAVVESAEWRTCTACHQPADAYHGENSKYSWSGLAPGSGTFDASRTLYDTHFDGPETDEIEGYVLDPADGRVCRNCHNQHAAGTEIQGQWARSGHGGRIARVKERAAQVEGAAGALTAGVADEDAPAWVHYDFKEKTGQRDGKGRQACQRCHTTTGFRNYADSLIAVAAALAKDPLADVSALVYDPAENEFAATGLQREMLYCQGCHTSNVGDLRDPGPITAEYTGDPVAYPDLAGSNLCMVCHIGRESGGTIANATGSFGSKTFINSHYLSAGGIVFATTGYEYEGADYANPAKYKHDKIGLDPEVAPETGEQGPCVGCHMSAAEDHLFKPVRLDPEDGGTVLEITATVCGQCHKVTDDGQDRRKTPEGLTESKRLFHDALHALEELLAARNFHFAPSYPYFFAEPGTTDRTKGVNNWLLDGDGDGAPDEVTGKPTMGAAFNYNLLHHDPGAYAHNRYYAKRLIYDSIDWLDDAQLNGSVRATLEALPETAAHKAGALAYLLTAEGTRP